MACASSKVMGKRKFKLGRTKERAKHSLIVSIERKNVSVHVAITRYQLEAIIVRNVTLDLKIFSSNFTILLIFVA